MPKRNILHFRKCLGFFMAMILIFTACNHPSKTSLLPPNIKVLNYDVNLIKNDVAWFYKGELFSGYRIETEKDGRIVYQLPIINGLENGIAKGVYNDGSKLLERNYVNGKIEGTFKQWWPNGHFRYLFHYRNNLLDGRQLVCYPNGNKRQISHYLNGEEEGLQQSWNINGQLVSNYTIKNKRLYGIIKVKNCISLSH